MTRLAPGLIIVLLSVTSGFIPGGQGMMPGGQRMMPGGPGIMPGGAGMMAGGPGMMAGGRRPNGYRQMMLYMGQMRAAEDLKCKTVQDRWGLDMSYFVPMICTNRCPFPTRCRQVGPYGFCCPFFVSDAMIRMIGLRETYKLIL